MLGRRVRRVDESPHAGPGDVVMTAVGVGSRSVLGRFAISPAPGQAHRSCWLRERHSQRSSRPPADESGKMHTGQVQPRLRLTCGNTGDIVPAGGSDGWRLLDSTTVAKSSTPNCTLMLPRAVQRVGSDEVNR